MELLRKQELLARLDQSNMGNKEMFPFEFDDEGLYTFHMVWLQFGHMKFWSHFYRNNISSLGAVTVKNVEKAIELASYMINERQLMNPVTDLHSILADTIESMRNKIRAQQEKLKVLQRMRECQTDGIYHHEVEDKLLSNGHVLKKFRDQYNLVIGYQPAAAKFDLEGNIERFKESRKRPFSATVIQEPLVQILKPATPVTIRPDTPVQDEHGTPPQDLTEGEDIQYTAEPVAKKRKISLDVTSVPITDTTAVLDTPRSYQEELFSEEQQEEQPKKIGEEQQKKEEDFVPSDPFVPHQINKAEVDYTTVPTDSRYEKIAKRAENDRKLAEIRERQKIVIEQIERSVNRAKREQDERQAQKAERNQRRRYQNDEDDDEESQYGDENPFGDI